MIALREALTGADRRPLERRLYHLLLVCLLGFSLLVARLIYLQVVRGSYFETLSRGNRIRLVSLTAPRGDILDRNGQLLATTRPAFTASLVYMGVAYTDETLGQIEEILSLEPGSVRVLIERQRGRWYEPIRLKAGISVQEHSRLEEQRHELPGLVIEVVPIREYPLGQLAAHVLGRVGTLNSETSRQSLEDQLAGYSSVLQTAQLEPRSYALDDIVGLIGLERQYDAVLRGDDGVRAVEVDSLGTPTRIEREEAPQAGLTLRLTLDVDLQRSLETSLAATMDSVRRSRGTDYATSAAAVVLDVKTGGVLAMASLPTFDPNWSASGSIEPQYVAQLEEFNRVIQGLYIPGSIYKMATAVAALEQGVVTLADRIWCGGGYRLGNDYIGCWIGPPGHGNVGLIEALAGSCNTYFLDVGARLRALARAEQPVSGMVDLLALYAPSLGLDGPTGIDLPFERAGRSPRTGATAWMPGEDIQCAIGQSRQEYSPLQLAVYTATLASGGTLRQPYLVEEILDGQEVVWRSGRQPAVATGTVSAATFDAVRAGMLAVTAPGGTAYSVFGNLPVKVAGKTGTAQTSVRPNDGLFVGFAPFGDPEIAWAIVVKCGESGLLSGAPVARALVSTWFGLDEAGTR